MTDVGQQIRIAMILAAGYGTRMNHLTAETPKPLLPLGEMTIIEVLINKLTAAGIERIVINLHYHAEKVQRYLGDGSKYGVEICYSHEPELLGSGGGIARAEQFFKGETILAANADVLSDINLRRFCDAHPGDALATMALLPSANNRDYSLVLFDEHQRITGFLARNATPLPSRNTGIFTGFQILTPEARQYLQPERQSIIEKFYRPAIAGGKFLQAYSFGGEWIDLGTQEYYENFRNNVLKGEIDLKRYIT